MGVEGGWSDSPGTPAASNLAPEPTVSVIVTTNGPSQTFERLIRSLARADGIEEAELLVALYGPDGIEPTAELLAEHLPTIRAHISSEPDTNSAQATRTATARAVGELLLFLPDDVTVAADLLVRARRTMADPQLASSSLAPGEVDDSSPRAPSPMRRVPGRVTVVRRSALGTGTDTAIDHLRAANATALERPELALREPDPPLDRRPAAAPAPFSTRRIRLLLLANFAAAGFYLAWWFHSGHVGTPALFAALAAAEGFSLCHVLGLWWTVWFTRVDAPSPGAVGTRSIDVFVTTCGEHLELLERTVAAAVALEGRHSTFVLDDAHRPEVAELARRLGAGYLTRPGRQGAKAGNLNRALERTSGELVCVFDADHAPQPDLLTRVLGYFEDPRLAFVQTPQFYANARHEPVARGAYQQQAIFYGPICRGKNGLNAAFCCGTNVVFRRAALEDVGGFEERSVVEDFVTSIRIHRKGWRSVYYPYVLAEGLGPNSLRSYFRQQFRWARGSVGALATGEPFRRGLSPAQRLQYLLATTFYMTGIFTAVYVVLPILYLAEGWSAFSPASGKFVFFYVPYLILGLLTVRLGLGGQLRLEHLRYTFGTFPVYATASLAALLHVRPRFRVTGQQGEERAFPGLAYVTLAAFTATAAAIVAGLILRPLNPATFTNISWAVINLLLLSGISGAAARELRRRVLRRAVPSDANALPLLNPSRLPHLQLPERALPSPWANLLPRPFAFERTTTYVAGLTLVGLVLRLGLVDVQSIRLDESLSLTEARASLTTMLHNLATWDIHPPLYYTLLHGWIHLAGTSAIALRLPSVLIGTACVPLTYAVGRRLVGSRAALLAAALGAASPFWVWHSDEARMYPLFLFTALLALHALTAAAERGGAARWSAYGLATAVSLYSHYFAALMIPVHLAYLLTRRDPRRTLLTWGAAAAAGLASFVPWLLFLASRRGGIRGIGSLETGLIAPMQHYSLVGTTYSVFLFLLVYVIGYGQSLSGGAGLLGVVARMLAGSWPLVAVFGGLTRELGRAMRSQRVVFLELWIVLTLGTVFGLNLWKHDLWLQRYLIITSPALFLLLGLGLSRVLGRHLGLGLVLVVATFVGATFVDNFDPHNQAREDWRGASALISRQMKPGDAVVVMPWFYVTPLDYYFHARLPVRGLLTAERGEEAVLDEDIPDIAARHSGHALWVVIAYENVFDPNGRIRATLDRRYRLTADVRLGGEMELRRYALSG